MPRWSIFRCFTRAPSSPRCRRRPMNGSIARSASRSRVRSSSSGAMTRRKTCPITRCRTASSSCRRICARRFFARAPELPGAPVKRLDRLQQPGDPFVARRHRLHDGGGLGVRRGEREHRLDLGHHPLHPVAVRLVDHEHVRDLHDPGLQGLHLVAEAGDQHHDAHVGGAHDLDLVLADPDRLDQDHVLAGGREHEERLVGGGGEAAEVPARGHRADEDAGVGGVGLHADAVAQDRPAAEGRGRVHRHDAHRPSLPAQVGGQAVHQGGLAGAGRAGHADHQRAPGVGEERRQERAGLGPGVLDEADRARDRPRVAGAHAGHEAVGRRRGLRHYRTTGRRCSSWRAMTRRCTSLVPSPMVPIFASRRYRSTG